MYMRSYYDSDGERHSLPEQGYDGTALREKPPKESFIHTETKSEEIKREVKISPVINKSEEKETAEASVPQGGGGFRLPSFIKSLFSGGSLPFHLPKNLGFEELLLIGIALYLFLSKSGDKECAVLLALLLFI